MAYTVTIKKHSFGSERCHLVEIEADGASQAVPTGLSYIDSLSLGCVSCATNGFSIKPNAGTASAVANGSILVASAAAGDRFFVQVYGRG